MTRLFIRFAVAPCELYFSLEYVGFREEPLALDLTVPLGTTHNYASLTSHHANLPILSKRTITVSFFGFQIKFPFSRFWKSPTRRHAARQALVFDSKFTQTLAFNSHCKRIACWRTYNRRYTGAEKGSEFRNEIHHKTFTADLKVEGNKEE